MTLNKDKYRMGRAILLTGILALLPHAVLAQQGDLAKGHGYFGGGIARVEYDERPDGSNDFFNAKVRAAYLRAGWQFNDHVSAEVRAGLGGNATGDVTVGNSTVEIDYKLDHFLGAYARGGLWLSDSFYPYLIGGFTRFKHEIEAAGLVLETSGSDFSYGLGADIATSEHWRINLEYMRYYDRDDTELNAIAIGLVKTF